jgi:hypothetical protein
MKRAQLKLQLEAAKKTAERKRSKLKQQLSTIRYEMAQEMTKVYKKGDKNKCIEASNSVELRKNYCTASLTEDYSALQDCIDGTDFCTMCCDLEFGEFYQGDREDCYKATCKSKKETMFQGRWVWQEAINPQIN